MHAEHISAACKENFSRTTVVMTIPLIIMDLAYMSRIVTLTTRAPDIAAAIPDETLPSEVSLFDLASGTPLLWEQQRAQIRIRSADS